MDMKARGMYVARTLAYKDCEFETVVRLLYIFKIFMYTMNIFDCSLYLLGDYDEWIHKTASPSLFFSRLSSVDREN